MCTVPHTTPVPPPLPVPDLNPAINTPKISEQNSAISNSDDCKWAYDNPHLREACIKNGICLRDEPYRYKYTDFDQVLQVGPTCGIAALSMLVKSKMSAAEILNIAKSEGYSHNGEMFSCRHMAQLANKVFNAIDLENVHCSLEIGNLFSKATVDKLLDGALLLVPYDADGNHSPCQRKGHTAHWAFICGVILIRDPEEVDNGDTNNIYVLARHGKSKFLAAWNLATLADSNKNLWEFSPKRGDDSLTYVLPNSGIGGVDGIRDQYLLFE